jgi:putative ABC transport system ATP-binding protein
MVEGTRAEETRAEASSGRHTAVPAVVADSVSYVRGGVTILDDVSVEAYRGQVLAIMGPSGSGKSSLLALLAGLERPDSGVVHLVDRPVDGVPDGFGVVLQGYGLVNLLTAAENVEIPLQARGVPAAAVRARAAAALSRVGLGHVADHLVEELSGGQQQRVAIARAFVVEPAVLIADEMTAELDTATKDVIAGLVLSLAADGAAVVLATHDPELADRCHRVVRLIDGRVAD